MVYFDSSYIAKCYLREHGTDTVLDLAEASEGRTSIVLAVVEVQAVFHRHMREGRLNQSDFLETCRRFERDQNEGFWHWLPLTDDFVRRAAGRFGELPSHLFRARPTACISMAPTKPAFPRSTRQPLPSACRRSLFRPVGDQRDSASRIILRSATERPADRRRTRRVCSPSESRGANAY